MGLSTAGASNSVTANEPPHKETALENIRRRIVDVRFHVELLDGIAERAFGSSSVCGEAMAPRPTPDGLVDHIADELHGLQMHIGSVLERFRHLA